MKSTKALGNEGEACAVQYLKAKGYHILATQFHAPHGELDIIAETQGTLVFVEVKTRSSMRFGTPTQAVDIRKQARICQAAMWYVYQQGLEDRACRFDVMEVLWQKGKAPRVRHYENAFEFVADV